MKKNKIVYIVHAVDTEGPLYESTKATFKRIEELFNIDISFIFTQTHNFFISQYLS